MAISDYVQSLTNKVLPEKRTSLPLQPSSTGMGIGSGGHVPFDDEVSMAISITLVLCAVPYVIGLFATVGTIARCYAFSNLSYSN